MTIYSLVWLPSVCLLFHNFLATGVKRAESEQHLSGWEHRFPDENWWQDRRCGSKFRIRRPDGGSGGSVECQPDSSAPCCNLDFGQCGTGDRFCRCRHCVDYQGKGNFPGSPECRFRFSGSDYSGSWSVSQSGAPCMPWKEYVSKNYFEFWDPNAMLPSYEDENFCRNPDGRPSGPWCIVGPHGRWEPCNIPLCEQSYSCSPTYTGGLFRGVKTKSVDDWTCSHWDDIDRAALMTAGRRIYDPHQFPEDDTWYARNFCRNPTDDSNVTFPHCVTSGRQIRPCSIGVCDTREFSLLTLSTAVSLTFPIRAAPSEDHIEFTLAIRFLSNQTFDKASINVYQAQNSLAALQIELREDAVSIGLENALQDTSKVFFKRSRLSPFQWFSITLRFLHWEVILSSPKEGLLLRHGQDFSMVGEEGFLNVRLKGRAVWDFEDFQTVAGCIHFQSRYGQTPFAWFSFPSKGPLRLSVWSDKGNAIVLLSPVATKDWERFLKFMKVVVVTDKGSLYIMNGTFDPSDHLSKAYIPSSRFQDDWWHFWITADPQTLAVGWGESSILPLMTSEVSRDEVRYYAPLSSLDMNWVINCGPSVLPIPPPPMASLSWSAWSPWNCSVPCGGGPGIQTRTCFSNVEDCPGPSNRTGLCNEEPCIKLTSNMLQNIQHRLSVTYNNLVLVSPGSPFRFSCESQVAQTVFQYYPDPKMRIFHLDTMLVEFKSHKSPEEEEHEIQIPRTVASDAGVYHCWLQASPGQKSVLLNIATLQFQTSETSVIHAPSTSEAVTARFRSFSSYFQGFLSPIRVTWLHEGSAWATATSKHASQLDVFELEVNEKMRGIWESVVEDTYSGRKWLTNRFFFEPKDRNRMESFLVTLQEVLSPVLQIPWLPSILLAVSIFVIVSGAFGVVLLALGTYLTERQKSNMQKKLLSKVVM